MGKSWLALAGLVLICACSSSEDASPDQASNEAGGGGAPAAGASGTGGSPAAGASGAQVTAGKGGAAAGANGGAGNAGAGAAGAGGSTAGAGGAGGTGGTAGQGGGPATSCTPSQQIACACPGSTVTGAQACNPDGAGYGACEGCPGGAGGTGGAAGAAGQGGAGAGQGGSTASGCVAQEGALGVCDTCSKLVFDALPQGTKMKLAGVDVTFCSDAPCPMEIRFGPSLMTLERDNGCAGDFDGQVLVLVYDLPGKVDLGDGAQASLNLAVDTSYLANQGYPVHVAGIFTGIDMTPQPMAQGIGCSVLGDLTIDCPSIPENGQKIQGKCNIPQKCDVFGDIVSDSKKVFDILAENVRRQLNAMAVSGKCTPDATPNKPVDGMSCVK